MSHSLFISLYSTIFNTMFLDPKESLEEISVNPGGTLKFGHSGDLNVTFCAVRRPDKTYPLQNDLIKNPLEDKQIR